MEQNPIVEQEFRPTDHKLVYKYLRKKLEGVLPDCEYIPEINIYDLEPWDLHDFSRKISKDDELHFFHAPKYNGKKASRCKRTTPAGFWKITGDPRKVRHEITNKEIGTKRTLVFRLGRGEGTPTEWIMHEYKYIEKHSNGGSASKSNEGVVLCKIKKKPGWQRGKNESSFNTPVSSMDQNKAGHLMTPSASNNIIVASSSNQSIGDLPMTSEVANKSESSVNTPIFAVDEMDPNGPVILSNKSESSFNNNISSHFHNGNEIQILANTAMYGNKAGYPMALADNGKASFDCRNQNQNLMNMDSSLPNGKVDGSESSSNTSISSSFVSEETNSAIYRNEDRHAMPSDLGNHIPDSSPSDSFEDVLGFNFGDFNLTDLLNHSFPKGIVQEVDSSQLISSSTNCQHPGTSM